ncbi:MAG TPA: hypothetical protein VK997_10295, partial [Deferrisomatales bacterium]|nr:hypothetical protein [Deferrisomatales bacterium]
MKTRGYRHCSALAVLCLFWLIPPAMAQSTPGPALDMPRLFGKFQPQLGAWSEYQLLEKASGKATRMRMAIVGQEGGAYWYEVTNDEGDNRNIIKMLVVGNPNEPDNIQRLIIKSGDNPAQEMPRDFVAMGRKMAAHMFEKRSGVPSGSEAQVRLEEAGRHQITVPAGTFDTTFYKILGAEGKLLAEYDAHPDVLPFGVVSSTTDSNTMVLLAHGDDAKSRITETPVVMTTPRGMPEGMPRGMPPGLPGRGPT